MNTTHQRLLSSLLIVCGALALTSPARAADTAITYALPSGDPSGITTQTAPGITGCLSGCSTLRITRGSAVAVRRQGTLAFSAPAGTTIVNAAIRLRYRTKLATVSAHIQSRVAGRWIDMRRLHSASGAQATVNAGAGGTAVAVTLTADGAVPGRAVKTDADNAVTVDSVVLTVRDPAPPTVGWTSGDPAGAGWSRGTICGGFEARDVGLGVDHVDYAVGTVVTTVAAGGGTRLQPRPGTLDGSVCVDTSQVGDGTYGTALSAVDGADDGNRGSTVAGIMRIDNTPPQVVYQAPADPEARLPVSQLTAADATSGLEQVDATIDGLPAVLHSIGGVTTVAPGTPLADGTHRLAWSAKDVAGNVATGVETFGVADTTPPTIDTALPQGVAGALEVISAHAIDTGAGLDTGGWRLAVDGLDVTGGADLSAPGTITYTPVRPWTEGDHVARVTAVDRSGNRTVRTWTFSLPVTPPPPAPIVAPAVVAESALVVDPVPTADAAATGTPHPRPKLTLATSTRTPRVGGEITLRGTVGDGAMRFVRIEARVGRIWRLVARVPVTAQRRFSTPVRLPQAGGYDVRARAGSSTSATLHLTARR